MSPAGKRAQGLLFDIVDDCDARRLVDVMNFWRDPRLRSDAHRFILMRIAQRTWRAFHSDKIAPAAGLDTIGEGA
jgi:hypothetical protein